MVAAMEGARARGRRGGGRLAEGLNRGPELWHVCSDATRVGEGCEVGGRGMRSGWGGGGEGGAM